MFGFGTTFLLFLHTSGDLNDAANFFRTANC